MYRSDLVLAENRNEELYGSECLPDLPMCYWMLTSYPPRLTRLTNAYTHTH